MADDLDAEILQLKLALKKARAEKQKQYLRDYYQRPEVKAKRRDYMREYFHRPVAKQKKAEYARERARRPEVKERRRILEQQPEFKERRREYSQRPEVKLAAKLRAAGLSKEVIKAELSRLKEAAE